MGYTHYWKFKKSPKSITNGEELFEYAVNSAKELIAQIPERIPERIWEKISDWDYVQKDGTETVPFKLCGGDGTGSPEFTKTLICFNGDAECGNDHETLYISLDSEGFDFCKTARKPYDVAVCITLICFKHYFGDVFEYHSDGNIGNGEEGWKLAKEITSAYFRE
jgi:hypothetical protein